MLQPSSLGARNLLHPFDLELEKLKYSSFYFLFHCCLSLMGHRPINSNSIVVKVVVPIATG